MGCPSREAKELRRRSPKRWAALLSVSAALVFPSALAEEVPLVDGSEISWETRRDALWSLRSARRAMAIGYYDVAAQLAQEAIETGSLDRMLRSEAELLIADTLLARGEMEKAESQLDSIDGQAVESSVALRHGLLNLSRALRSLEGGSRSELELILFRVEEPRLDEEELAWLNLLHGWLLLQEGRTDEAEKRFEQSRETAASLSASLEARILYLIFRSKLRASTSVEKAALQRAVEDYENSEIGFAYAQQLATVLHDEGETEAAVELISRQLEQVPALLRAERDRFLLLQTVIAGMDRPVGRRAAEALLAEGGEIQLMRIGLQSAVDHSLGMGEDRTEFLLSLLNQVVAARPEHPLADEALYYRSALWFYRSRYDLAERDATSLLERFPESKFAQGALATMASSAWKRQQYRRAASLLSRLRSEYADEREAVMLSVLIADSYFRAGEQGNSPEDYRNSGEAYLTAIDSLPRSAESSQIYFQLALAFLRGGEVERARSLIDSPELRRKASSEDLWRAEWALLKAMRASGRVDEAYERVQYDVNVAQPDANLQLRFFWMATKLSLEAGEPDDTAEWLGRLESFIADSGEESLGMELVQQVRASAMLTLAEARFAIEETEEAIALLSRLREQYSGYEPAKFSYIVEARFLSSENRTVEAQQLLVYLADTFPDSRLAPMALYEAALNAERRGQDQMLEQASKLLTRIIENYPNSEMVYYAYLKQADLLRKLNKFGAAQSIYEFVEIEYSHRADLYLAQISLADTLIAQASENPSKFEAAISRLELLMDLRDVPLDLRVEAGYKLGVAWRNQGETDKAKRAFWTLYDLLGVEQNRVPRLGSKGWYWLSRTLFAMAELETEARNLDRSVSFYRKIINLNLSGAELARNRIEMIRQSPAN